MPCFVFFYWANQTAINHKYKIHMPCSLFNLIVRRVSKIVHHNFAVSVREIDADPVSLRSRNMAAADSSNSNLSSLRSASYVSCQRDTASICGRTPCCSGWALRPCSIDRYLLPTGRTAANPQQRSAAGKWWNRSTDWQTDARPLYRACCV